MINICDDEKYSAVIGNDINFDGLFYYAVKSTGIYCRPSCRSRAPKRENTLFFGTASDAQKAGFKPCKRCRSDLLSYEPTRDISAKVKSLIDEMFFEQAKLKSELRGIGISYRQMVEIFKNEYGQTPKAYIDSLRIKEAKRQLAQTDTNITDIALSVGFGSLSAFYRLFKEHTGTTPAAYRKEF